MDKMHGDNYGTIDKYLNGCYETGYVGTMYSIAGQGVPLVIPVDQAAAVKAVLTDSKVSNGLYNALGVNVKKLKKTITQEISRGIASSLPYSDIARNISSVSKAPLSRAKTIARTEGHRIQQTSARDAQYAAKKKGADVVKQWDAALDGRTRDSHARVDGEIRELDEKFSNGLKYPGDPSGGAAEVVNCRCTANTRARWALDEEELQTLKERAEYFGLDKTANFEDFKQKYLKAAEEVVTHNRVAYNGIANTTTIKELEYEMKRITGKDIDLSGTDFELIKKNMAQIAALSEEYGVHFDAIETTAARKYLGEVSRSGRYGDNVSLLYPKKYYKSRDALIEELRKTASSGNMPRIGGRNIDVYSSTHEFAHTLSSGVTSRLYGKDTAFWDEIEDVYMDYKKAGNGILGKYAASNQDEFLAEAFADAKLGARPSTWSEQVLSIVDKYFKKPLEKSATGDIIKSFSVGKGLGAAAKNYPVKLLDSKQHVKLAEGQSIPGKVFAGKGTSTEIRDRFRLESDYKIPADEWQKVSGTGYIVLDGKKQKAELHWYEAEGEIFEMKVKRYIDES